MSGPRVLEVSTARGVAGAVELVVRVEYPGEDPMVVRFVGSFYGGPVVMVTPGNPRGVFVDSSVVERCGSTLDARWVRRFFGVEL